MLHAKKLLDKGCSGYVAYVINKSKDELKVSDIPIVCEFGVVFPEDLSSLPINHEIEFVNDIFFSYNSYLKGV